jgi:hypothetical protein
MPIRLVLDVVLDVPIVQMLFLARHVALDSGRTRLINVTW